ncbi:non-homologous end joining protein Ku [Streptacidiphilus neutrinimicus]|uniref:non-homologous end joining protein Ku n=1 Tax=Streptacidiphilus neutrinimicus TaxID=105420 RepID=UPI0005A910C9|nr:Ku protein [Streptacidiphilus neutrinimicus]
MPRSVWTGSITFGLVAVPVKLYPATETHSGPVLHQVHREDGSRVRLKRFCEAEDREVEYGEIARGWDTPDGGVVVLTDEDLATLPVPSKKIIDVVAFLPAERIDPLRWDSPYYVGLGDKAPAKPYVLLREAMRDSGLVAVTKVTMRSRESLAVLRVQDDLLVLQTMRWPDEIRSREGLAPEGDATLRPQELAMARSLMDTLSEDFDLDAEKDQYAVALEDLLDAKAHGATPAPAPAAEGGAEVIDLMAALRSSVAAAKASRGEAVPGEEESGEEESEEGAEEASAPKARKRAESTKRTGEKQTGKEPAAKKSTAAKATASKSTATKSTATKSTATKSTASKAATKKAAAKKTASTARKTAPRRAS